MPVQLRFKKHISVGQKSKNEPGVYGQGFNYAVEADFGESCDEGLALRALREVLKDVDHRHLSLDSELIPEPNSENLCRYIFEQLKSKRVQVTGFGSSGETGLLSVAGVNDTRCPSSACCR